MEDNTTDLALQVHQLNGRLARIEETVHRLEDLLIGLSAESITDDAQVLHDLPATIRVASPRLRDRHQAADFVMTVTRDT